MRIVLCWGSFFQDGSISKRVAVSRADSLFHDFNLYPAATALSSK